MDDMFSLTEHRDTTISVCIATADEEIYNDSIYVGIEESTNCFSHVCLSAYDCEKLIELLSDIRHSEAGSTQMCISDKVEGDKRMLHVYKYSETCVRCGISQHTNKRPPLRWSISLTMDQVRKLADALGSLVREMKKLPKGCLITCSGRSPLMSMELSTFY